MTTLEEHAPLTAKVMELVRLAEAADRTARMPGGNDKAAALEAFEDRVIGIMVGLAETLTPAPDPEDEEASS